MQLNAAGEMIAKWWKKISEKFPDILLDEFIIMPNHFHAIVENTGAKFFSNTDIDVRANPCVRPKDEGQGNDTDLPSDTGQTQGSQIPNTGQTQGSAPTGLYSIVQWFKTMSTNEYIRNVKNSDWEPFDKKVWQRNYHEHIIRNQQSYQMISEYIKSNPTRWEQDKFFMA